MTDLPSPFPYQLPEGYSLTHVAQLDRAAAYGLSELDILILKTASYGLTCKEAGDVLRYSALTIQSARRPIMQKLRAKTFAQAVANALRFGLIA